ncbi:ABC transporter permease [Bremerella cremea]|uniref:ABC transporter permease n=1 Tax=Bremerella cremea TaxID=1031537 RepID=UPI0031E55897
MSTSASQISERDLAVDVPSSDVPMQYFESEGGISLRGFYELWVYRHLVWMLVVRDVKVRYRQTAVGVAWAVLQPALLMLVFNIFFQLLGRQPSEGNVPYVVTFLCGYLPWQLLASTLGAATQSLVAHQNLISKVYFPRAVLPISATVGGLIDFCIACVLLLGLMVWYGVVPPVQIILLPLFVLLSLLISIGAGLWLSALNALYRDIGYVVPFILQVGFFISPVIYETDQLIPGQYRSIYALNPMVGVLEGVRWCILGHAAPTLSSMVISFVTLGLLLVGGMIYFRQIERQVVDRI